MVLADVPRGERCRCGEGSSTSSSVFKVTPKPTAAAPAAQGKLRSWLSK